MEDYSGSVFQLDPAATPQLTAEELADRLRGLAVDLAASAAAALPREYRVENISSVGTAWPVSSGSSPSGPSRSSGFSGAAEGDSAGTVSLSDAIRHDSSFSGYDPGRGNTVAVQLEALVRDAARQSELLERLVQELNTLTQLLESAVSGGVVL